MRFDWNNVQYKPAGSAYMAIAAGLQKETNKSLLAAAQGASDTYTDNEEKNLQTKKDSSTANLIEQLRAGKKPDMSKEEFYDRMAVSDAGEVYKQNQQTLAFKRAAEGRQNARLQMARARDAFARSHYMSPGQKMNNRIMEFAAKERIKSKYGVNYGGRGRGGRSGGSYGGKRGKKGGPVSYIDMARKSLESSGARATDYDNDEIIEVADKVAQYSGGNPSVAKAMLDRNIKTSYFDGYLPFTDSAGFGDGLDNSSDWAKVKTQFNNYQ